ncbi:hypothetical protein Tco_1491135 [Tanacetum coccineum]
MNYVPSGCRLFTNEFFNYKTRISKSGTSSQQDQDCIVMPIWKDASYFDDASLKSVADAQLQDQDGTHEIASSVQTRRMTTCYSELGFLVPYRRKESRPTAMQEETPTCSNYRMYGFLYTCLKDIRAIVTSWSKEAKKAEREDSHQWLEIEAIRSIPGFNSLIWVLHLPMDVKSPFHVKSASTPTDLEKPLVKDADADDVDEHLYRSMIGSLMYLTASRPDIMFAVCACARFQVSPKTSHLLAVKRIFRYLKGKPSLGLWYSKDSPLELVAYTDSDYAGATLDRKSTIGGCQFLGNRLISWQCKKQTVVATSTTEAEYVAAASCCGQVLWIQNQLLDYGYNFMNTVIYIDNTSTICIIENPVQHSKTKHIEIRHHFIRDCNTKKLIQMAKIDTQLNVADLLTKGFDAGRFQYLVSSIGMLNP